MIAELSLVVMVMRVTNKRTPDRGDVGSETPRALSLDEWWYLFEPESIEPVIAVGRGSWSDEGFTVFLGVTCIGVFHDSEECYGDNDKSKDVE